MSGQTAFHKCVTLAALCRGGEAEISQFEEIEETEMDGVAGEDRMSEEATDEVEGQRESAAARQASGSRSSEQTDAERRQGTTQRTCRSETCAHTV